ncbi:hypothetical protein RJ639_012976 [Escallonia herrerae]|uniref:Aminotransferase-like plant mobile domain-containing protein n=1 Tax=Escallonia herrerae TaxID=1293975 RepID=A0AA89AN20_9ASTE|nr:hypothetical protein RJ639_012976 [Escallonia herrerae]
MAAKGAMEEAKISFSMPYLKFLEKDFHTLWAWERCPNMRPERGPERVPPVEDRAQPAAVDIQHNEAAGDAPVAGGGPPQPHEVEPLPRDPLGRRWLVALESDKVGSQCLRGYRDQLDNLKSTEFKSYAFYIPQFIWQPYDLASLPEYCLTGRHVWMTRSPLICFERVEWHFPDRVCPQYSMRQVIPRDCDTGGEVLHKIDRRGHPNTDWELKHRVYIDMWNARADTIYSIEAAREYVDAGYSSPYMLWYRSITRLLVGKPVQNIPSGYQGGHATVEMLAQQIKRIFHLADSTDPNAAIESLSSIKVVCREALSAICEAERISTDTTSYSGPTTTAGTPKGTETDHGAGHRSTDRCTSTKHCINITRATISPTSYAAAEHEPLTSHSTTRTPPAHGPSSSTPKRSNRPHTPGSNAPISANETAAVHHMPSPLLHESEMEGIVKDIPSKIPPISTDPLACYEMVQEQLEPIEKETHGSVPYHSFSSGVIAGSRVSSPGRITGQGRGGCISDQFFYAIPRARRSQHPHRLRAPHEICSPVKDSVSQVTEEPPPTSNCGSQCVVMEQPAKRPKLKTYAKRNPPRAKKGVLLTDTELASRGPPCPSKRLPSQVETDEYQNHEASDTNLINVEIS